MTASLVNLKEEIRRYYWERPEGRRLPIGMGCAYIGEHRGGHPLHAAEDLKILERAYKEGIRFFDTSSDYQEGGQ